MADQLDDLIVQLNSASESLRNKGEQLDRSNEQIKDLSSAAEAVVKEIKSPMDQYLDMLINVAHLGALRVLMKCTAFDVLPSTGAISYEELARRVSGETSLITRLARMLVSVGILKQEGDNSISHTSKSKMFLSGSPLCALVETFFGEHSKAIISMPDYFKKYGLKEPSTRTHTVSAFAAGEPEATVWELLSRDPEKMTAFMTVMATMSSKMSLFGTYDFAWLVEQVNKSQDRPLAVDVGGSKGHAIKGLCQAVPRIPAHRCVVEDLQEVVDEAKAQAVQDEILKDVRWIATDFHKEQPVKGALLYYIRRCLHDYGDEDCIKILSHIADAMAPDSRLLIVEQILDITPHPLTTAGDIVMCTIGGKERTLEGFHLVTKPAGLRISSVTREMEGDIASIECVKA